MNTAQLLEDGFGRVVESVERTLDGLDDAELTHRPAADANSIAWLVWHLTRVQDDHLADAFDVEQVYTTQGFAQQLGECFAHDPSDTGYGHDAAQVAAVRAPAELLLEYLTAVHAQTVALVADVSASDLDRVVDDRWDPPVTLGVRLVSVLDDDLEHAGQAAYLRGILPQ
ncbi:mycothiol transferase [Aeromicrobium sp. Sec7.5]|uniref:mycothiol transferase n=1 Tax=Aeromicrobium sp. Sec7.5 TaxID=3121276 RepID=UPI002FE4D57C